MNKIVGLGDYYSEGYCSNKIDPYQGLKNSTKTMVANDGFSLLQANAGTNWGDIYRRILQIPSYSLEFLFAQIYVAFLVPACLGLALGKVGKARVILNKITRKTLDLITRFKY
jgi:hypothetical protein